MRSQTLFEAVKTFGRFQLCNVAAKATRKLHVPGNRVQDTTNDVFRRLIEENSTRNQKSR